MKDGTGQSGEGDLGKKELVLLIRMHLMVFWSEIIALIMCARENVRLGYKGKNMDIDKFRLKLVLSFQNHITAGS